LETLPTRLERSVFGKIAKYAFISFNVIMTIALVFILSSIDSFNVFSEETYKTLSSDIEERLKKLEEREELINRKYTEQFGKMEQAMTQFNSTKTLLENFIEAWKKQK